MHPLGKTEPFDVLVKRFICLCGSSADHVIVGRSGGYHCDRHDTRPHRAISWLPVHRDVPGSPVCEHHRSRHRHLVARCIFGVYCRTRNARGTDTAVIFHLVLSRDGCTPRSAATVWVERIMSHTYVMMCYAASHREAYRETPLTQSAIIAAAV
jgi:hypothetical protein